MNRLIIITGCLLILLACHRGIPAERMLFDFESDAELDRFHWRCHTLFSLSDEHVSHGARSLRIELYPPDYPGLNPILKENDWRGFGALCFDIFNPEENEIRVSVRIDDREDYPNYDDRYNKTFILRSGMNRMRISLDTLVTSGTKRKLDLCKIYRVLIFVARPERRVVLFVDYLRLTAL